MFSSQLNEKSAYNIKTLSVWFEEVALPVAPACNMMFSYSKESDCL